MIGTPGEVARGGAPVAEVAAGVAERFPEPGRIVVDPEWLAGNLHYLRPDWSVERAQDAVLAPGETALLVVMDGRRTVDEVVGELAARSGRALALGEAAAVSAPYAWRPAESLVLRAVPLEAAQ